MAEVVDTSKPRAVYLTDEPLSFCPCPDACGGCETVQCEMRGCAAPAVYHAFFGYDPDEFYCAAHVPEGYRALVQEE